MPLANARRAAQAPPPPRPRPRARPLFARAADATAGALLARLNEEIAALYGDDDAGGGDGGDDEYDDGGEGDDGGDFGDEYGGEPGADDGPRVELPKGPRPYDLWRAAHEVERPAREVRGCCRRRRVLARGPARRLAACARLARVHSSALPRRPPFAESGADVERMGRAGFAPERVVAAQAGALGAQARFAAPRAPPPSAQHSRASFASSRPPPPRFCAQGFLLRAQHQQIAAELAGLTFVPHISEKSRELAAQNKSLPARVEALQRRKKAKLDKIRHERVEDELKEATFKPDLSATKNSRSVVKTADERRKIGHLIQYVRGLAR